MCHNFLSFCRSLRICSSPVIFHWLSFICSLSLPDPGLHGALSYMSKEMAEGKIINHAVITKPATHLFSSASNTFQDSHLPTALAKTNDACGQP
jgi:hypothetical protein